MQLAIAIPGTTPTYWLDADDELILTALDELDRREKAVRKGGRRV